MFNSKNTKRSLLMSALALVLCVSMLVGSTFAWFTDTASTSVNKIQSGTLDIQLLMYDGANWVSAEGETLNFIAADGNQNILWEPGCTYELPALKVVNKGNLSLKYQIHITGIEGDAKLLEVIDFTIEGEDSLNGTLAPNAETPAITLIGHMAEEAGNDYQGKTLDAISITVVATQLNAENDSYGPDYDEDAWHPAMKVYNANDLQAAINNGETNLVLMNDVETDEVIVFNSDVALNLNGNTVNASFEMSEDVNVSIVNGQIVNDNAHVSGIQVNKGNLTLSNVEIASARHAVRVEGGEVTINGGTYKAAGSAGKTQHALNVSDGGKVVINGGTFVGPKGTASDSGSAVNVQAGSTVTINGGNFSGGKLKTLASNGTLTVKGGTFDQDPTAYLDNGYKAVLTNGKYAVVSESIDYVVSAPGELATALNAAAAAGAGDTTILLGGDIDLAGASWTPIKVDGYNGAGVVTIEGNGATIKGLTAPLFAGGFAGKSGIVIKNLTIADSNIVSTSGLGGGAFVDSADSMHVITLENCHLINSTVSGERAGGLIGWCTGYAKLNDGPVKAYVTISNCSVVDSTVTGAGSAGAIAGHPGASDYTYTTIENCKVQNVDVISNDDGSWRTGAIVGTANNGHVVINKVTVENVTLTQNGVTATETKLYGRFVPAGTGTLEIDGVVVLANATSEGLKDAVASGDADVYLPAGEYKMPSSATTGTVTITGTKETVIDATLGAYMDSADGVTIEGVTIKTGTGMANGNGSDYAALYAKNVTYINCTFVGPMRVGRDGAKFVNCTFTELGNDYIWTYGNDVTFEGCTFNTDGKAILIYSDGGNEISQVSVKKCTFNATQGAKAGAIANQNCAAIEIHNYGNGVNLVTEGNTYDSNFSGEWRIKTYETGKTKIFVNGVEYTTIAIDGKTMTIDADKNVTVQ